MKKKSRIGLVAAGSMLLVGVAASPSQAATTHFAGCDTTGASGTVNTSGWDYEDTSIPSVDLTVWDTKADGHHVAIRLVTAYTDGYIYFPWHADYDGYATSKEVNSSVAKGGNIFNVGIQVGTFEGNTLLNHCTKWVDGSTRDPS
ncbi:hypothetical protein [Streptomyces sp. NPDC021562]|uniref:hypothetical protein n=1 Tax=Streptomyces sp. NPDC021562 TaxID=3155121 RepID=UPI0033FDC3BF